MCSAWRLRAAQMAELKCVVVTPSTLFLADYTINIAGFEFSTGTGQSVRASTSSSYGSLDKRPAPHPQADVRSFNS